MTLQELVNQRFQNTVYVHPDVGKPFIVKNELIYNKSLEIVKIFYNLYVRYSFKLLDELFIVNSLFLRSEDLDLRKEFNNVDELIPPFEELLKRNKELFEIIIQKNEIHDLPLEDYKFNVKTQIDLLCIRIFKRFFQLQESCYIPMHYNVFVELDYNKYYRAFEDYIYSEYQYFKIFIEFQNLELERGCVINLDERMEIRWFDDVEYHLFNNRISKPNERYREITNSPFLIIVLKARKNKGYDMSTDSEGPRGVFKHSQELLDKFIYDVLTVLRLFSDFYVGFKRVFSVLPGINDHYFEHFMSYLYSNSLSLNRKKYQLKIQNQESLKELFAKYSVAEKDKVISSAIRRFNFAYVRRDEADKVIDYFIALESIFQIDGKSKQGRLSIEVSNLIGKSDEEKREIRKKVTKYYNLRNDIMHDPNSVNTVHLAEAVKYMNQITRFVILSKLKVGLLVE